MHNITISKISNWSIFSIPYTHHGTIVPSDGLSVAILKLTNENIHRLQNPSYYAFQWPLFWNRIKLFLFVYLSKQVQNGIKKGSQKFILKFRGVGGMDFFKISLTLAYFYLVKFTDVKRRQIRKFWNIFWGSIILKNLKLRKFFFLLKFVWAEWV